MFRYHHNVDLFSLREAGVRTFREMEEMIEGHSFADPVPNADKIYRYTGFTRESKALEVIVEMKQDEIDFVTLHIRKPTVEEIIKNFCRYCNSRRLNT